MLGTPGQRISGLIWHKNGASTKVTSISQRLLIMASAVNMYGSHAQIELINPRPRPGIAEHVTMNNVMRHNTNVFVVLHFITSNKHDRGQ